MPEFEITVARSARKELEVLDRRAQDRVLLKIEALARSPRPAGCVKLVGGNRLWRIRIGDIRVVYDIDDHHRRVDVVVVRHRRDVYR